MRPSLCELQPSQKKEVIEHSEQFVALVVSILPFVYKQRQLIASCRCRDGSTWLHVAAADGHLQACETLVDIVGRLPLHARNDAGEQPLALAVSYEIDRF